MVILYAPPVYLVLLAWRQMCDLAPVLAAFALAAISLAKTGAGPRPDSVIDLRP